MASHFYRSLFWIWRWKPSLIFHCVRTLLQFVAVRHRFSALWLRSKLVTVLIELTFDISSIEESKVVWFLEAWSEPGLAPTDHGLFQRGTRAGYGPHPQMGWIWSWRDKGKQIQTCEWWNSDIQFSNLETRVGFGISFILFCKFINMHIVIQIC